MRLLARYLLRECLAALGFCFSAFLILWVALDLLSQLHTLQENRMRAGDIVQFYVFRIPEFLPVALPVSLLLALLYALTNHARHNEITAMRAAGVSLWRICLPYVALGLVATAALFVSNELFAQKTGDIAEQILTRRVRQRPGAADPQLVKTLDFRNARDPEGRHWFAGTYRPLTTEMTTPVVEWKQADGSRHSLFAARAIYTNGVWTFYHARESKQSAGTNSLWINPPPIDVMPRPEFSETPEEINSDLDVGYNYSHPTRTMRADIPIAQILTYQRLHPQLEPMMRAWLDTRLHGRFAGPCACLVVVFLAVPFTTATGRRNIFVGVAASIFIFFIYFPLQQVGFVYGQTGHIPPWLGAWLPNLLFAIAGLWMMFRVR